MDLTAAITNFQQANVIAGVQTRIARKVLDMQKFQGAAAVKLIEAASKTASAGDALVAASTGLGGEFDTYA